MDGTCKLCGNQKELRHSHIFPDFYIWSRQAWLKTGNHGVAHPHSFAVSTEMNSNDGWKQRNFWEKELGWKEYLLCGDCERRLGAHESYARVFFYGNARPPLKKRSLGVVVPNMSRDFLETREVAINFPELKLFQMSLLWRAGVATGKFYGNVHLRQKDEIRLRHFLLHGNPGSETDYPCAVFDLRSLAVEFEGYSEKPTRSRDDHGQRNYRIIVGGYAFLYCASSAPRSPMFFDFCAKRNGTMLMPVIRGDLFLQRCAARLKKAKKL